MKCFLKLIDKVNYDFYERPNGELVSSNLSLEQVAYTADEIVNVNSDVEALAVELTNRFKNLYTERGLIATQEQLYFMEEFAKVVFGIHKADDLFSNTTDRDIVLIPASCGFGKSTAKGIILQYMVEQIKAGVNTDGAIIVGDKLDDLRDVQDIVGKDHAYLLQSWNQEICLDTTIKQADYRVCKNCNFENCPIKIQQKEQFNYPILLITNARLKELGISINNYKEWSGGERKLLLIDERPQITDNVYVDIKLLDDINSYLNTGINYDTTQDKTNLCNLYKQIYDKVESMILSLRGSGYGRWLVSIDNKLPLTNNDELFKELWGKYVGNEYSKELDHIKTVLRKGGFYVYERKAEFIATLGHKNLRDNFRGFKTFIMDGSSLYDPQYRAIMDYSKFLYVPNTRTYDNLNINIHLKHKITKTEFNNKGYIVDALNQLLKNSANDQYADYVVTYKEQFGKIQLNNPNSFKGYFGNTKGSNAMSNCNRMWQFGWETMPDYIYVIEFLSCCVDIDQVMDFCRNDEEFAKSFSSDLEFTARDITTNKPVDINNFKGSIKFSFGSEKLNIYKWLSIVCNFYQEVHRTTLRKYSYTGKIEVNLFNTESVIFNMIEKLFTGCNVNYITDELPEFATAKIMARKTSDGKFNNTQLVLQYLQTHNILIIKDMLTELGLTDKQYSKIKTNKGIKAELSKFTVTRQGNTRILTRN